MICVGNNVSYVMIIICCGFLAGCAYDSMKKESYYPEKPAHESLIGLTPSQQYAGEILSYLMQVVLGHAGHPRLRKEWRKASFGEKLDLKNISAIMSDEKRNKSSLIVHDSKILGLSEVLYHYDISLNQFKGKYIFDSIYPSPELIAMRLLLLQLLDRGEKMNIKSFFEREHIIFDYEYNPTAEDLHAINLTAGEMQLLKDIFTAEPHFRYYMKSPFLINAFYKTGVIERDDFVLEMISKANYKKYSCRYFRGAQKKDAIKISILPSLISEFNCGINEFDYGDYNRGRYKHGFKPTRFYNEMVDKLINKILDATKFLIKKEINKNKDNTIKIKGKKWDALWKKIVNENIGFYNEDERPLVLYPGNADQVSGDVCPGADVSIILMGKDVYLSIDFESEKYDFPHTNRIYLDIIDVKYSMVEEEIAAVSRFIFSKLKDDLGELVK